MASIADTLIAGQAESARPANVNHSANIGAGIQLAQHIQEVQMKREELKQKQAEQEQAKFEKVGTWFDMASKMPEGKAKKAFVNEYIPKGISALGLENQFDPTSMKMLTGDPMLGAFLRSKVQSGEMSFPEMLSALKDGEVMAKIYPQVKQFGDEQLFKDTVEGNIDSLGEDAKYAVSEEGKSARASLMAKGVQGRQENQQEFTKEQKTDERAQDIGKQYLQQNIPSMKSTISKIDKIIPGGVKKYDGKEQIAGIGGNDALLPIGRLSKQGRANRQLAIDLGNQYIKMATGSGVSTEESIRLLNSIGMDAAIGEGGGLQIVFKGTKDSADFVNGVKNLQDKMKSIENTIKAGAGPEAAQKFESNLSAVEKTDEPKVDWGAKLAAQKDRAVKLKPADLANYIKGVSERSGLSVAEVKKRLGVK